MEFRGQEIIRDRHDRPIYTKTDGQDRLVEAIKNNDIIFVNGPSGTGKTVIATWLGIKGIDDGIYEKLILTRPVVTSGEELGFLPGTLDEKIAPYMQPLYDAISLIKGRRKSEDEAVKEMPVLTAKEKRRLRAEAKEAKLLTNNDFYEKVQVCPLAYIRGSTLAKSYIVCDEFQNTTIMQMKTMITRLGKDSKMIICGDPNQCDLPSKVTSGFRHAQQLLHGVPRIGFVTLGVDDIVRHRMMKEIILRYEVPGYKPNSGIAPKTDEFYAIPSHTWSRDPEGYDFSEDDEYEEHDEAEYEPIDIDPGYVQCPKCHGYGTLGRDEHTCPQCKGTGQVPETDE